MTTLDATPRPNPSAKKQKKLMEIDLRNLELSIVKADKFGTDHSSNFKLISHTYFSYKTTSLQSSSPDDGSQSNLLLTLEPTKINLTPSSTLQLVKILRHHKSNASAVPSSRPVDHKWRQSELMHSKTIESIEMKPNKDILRYEFNFHEVQFVSFLIHNLLIHVIS